MLHLLIVEDDAVVRRSHEIIVSTLSEFKVVGAVGTAAAAIDHLQHCRVDVVLLDFHLPDAHGLTVPRAAATLGIDVDVIAVTAARDLEAVRNALSHGAMQYLMKPFTANDLRHRLTAYAADRAGDRRRTPGAPTPVGQSTVDTMFDALRQREDSGPRRPGEAVVDSLAADTADAVRTALHGCSTGLTAADVAAELGVSRVTARRYLEQLTRGGSVRRELRYGKVGRPEVVFRTASAE